MRNGLLTAVGPRPHGPRGSMAIARTKVATANNAYPLASAPAAGRSCRTPCVRSEIRPARHKCQLSDAAASMGPT